MYWPYRRAYDFRVTPDVFHFALLLDAQRWTPNAEAAYWYMNDLSVWHFRTVPLKQFYESLPIKGATDMMLGYRTEVIRFLKRICDTELHVWRTSERDTQPLVWWEPWSPRPLPTWTVTVYGLTHTFNEYMTPIRLAVLMHNEHSAKGFYRRWCVYCNPPETTEELLSVLSSRQLFE